MYENIENQRVRLGLTRKELARNLGIRVPTLATYVCNGGIPMKVLFGLRGSLHCPLDYLLDTRERAWWRKKK